MKKAILILLVGLFWCSVGFAFTVENALLAINVNPPDASCVLKKNNKKILENIYPDNPGKHNKPFEDNSIWSAELFVKIPGIKIAGMTKVNIICEKDGYVTAIDVLKYSQVTDLMDVTMGAIIGGPMLAFVDLLTFHFGTYFIEYDKSDIITPAHRINLIKGEGTVVYKHGKIYEGETKNGKYHGEGVLKLSNGTVYKGEFKNGKMHGHGTITLFDGETYEGNFEKNKLVELNKIQKCIKGNCSNGQGTYLFPSGNKYVGEFKDGELIKQQ